MRVKQKRHPPKDHYNKKTLSPIFQLPSHCTTIQAVYPLDLKLANPQMTHDLWLEEFAQGLVLARTPAGNLIGKQVDGEVWLALGKGIL